MVGFLADWTPRLLQAVFGHVQSLVRLASPTADRVVMCACASSCSQAAALESCSLAGILLHCASRNVRLALLWSLSWIWAKLLRGVLVLNRLLFHPVDSLAGISRCSEQR